MKGEKAQGIEVKITTNAMEYQMAMALNFSLSFFLRRAIEDPMVTKLIPISIMVICSMPKKRSCV